MPEPSKNLILCVHAHQPVGNFGWVFEEAYEKSYRPFFETLEKHPRITCVAHFSGSLIDWLEKNKPEFLTLLRKMADRGQLDFLGGGYYEPIFGVIPPRDLKGQIALMREKVRSLFGVETEGAWLTERVWDPPLVRHLSQSSVKYTILDDLHFEKAGLKAPVTGAYEAAEGRARLTLFATMKDLRYLMPFRQPQETLDFIHSQKAGPGDVFVFADDCEKFGFWPGTYDWVYREKWLERFFTLLERDPGIRLGTFSQFLKDFKPKRRVRIPHASYSEMMEWSGGHFYNFFKKYPESRYMRERTEALSGWLSDASSKNGSRMALYRAQCNCSYWHGVFGGLYLHHLRSAVFENLIEAEEALKPVPVRRWALPSGTRLELRQKSIATFFNPAYGGALEELDFLPKRVNLMCNLQRHKELYHEAVLKKVASAAEGQPLSIHEMLGAKQKDLDKNLHYDPLRRLSFIDHFFESEVSETDFARSVYDEKGDFSGKPYTARVSAPSKAPSITLARRGSLDMGREKFKLVLNKVVTGNADNGIRVSYEFRNPNPKPLSFVFGIEFNFSIGDKEAMKGFSKPSLEIWTFHDSWRDIKLELKFSEVSGLLAAPVETVSESESGLEKTYQELGVLAQRRFEIAPRGSQTYAVELTVSPCS